MGLVRHIVVFCRHCFSIGKKYLYGGLAAAEEAELRSCKPDTRRT